MNFTSKRLFSGLALFFTLIFVFFGIRQSRVNAVPPDVVPGSLEALAQTVAGEGGSSFEIGIPMYQYSSIGGINQALSEYSVVVAHPTSSNSYVWDSENQIIGSWYKFSVSETLSAKPFPSCALCLESPDAPSGMTAGSCELLVAKYGGVVSVNGVTISSTDLNFPNYQTSQNYLLFLHIDSSKKVGVLAGGPVAAFTVSANGVLAPASPINSTLAQEISQTYGNSLAALRSALGGGSWPTPTPTPTPTPCSVANQVISYCTNNGGQWDPQTCTCY
jgi:hypothetical protein